MMHIKMRNVKSGFRTTMRVNGYLRFLKRHGYGKSDFYRNRYLYEKSGVEDESI